MRKRKLLFFILPFLSPANCIAGEFPVLVEEVSRLETNAKGGTLGKDDAGLLSELYFLTGRCVEVAKMQKYLAPSGVTCACGLKCPKGSDVGLIEEFKKALLKFASPAENARVIAIWKKIAFHPEAKYLYYKALIKPSKQKLELEKELAALEIR